MKTGIIITIAVLGAAGLGVLAYFSFRKDGWLNKAPVVQLPPPDAGTPAEKAFWDKTIASVQGMVYSKVPTASMPKVLANLSALTYSKANYDKYAAIANTKKINMQNAIFGEIAGGSTTVSQF